MVDLIIAAWMAGRCDRTGVDELLIGLSIFAAVVVVFVLAVAVAAGLSAKTNSRGVL